MKISIIVAFSAGLLSFLSPCVLPLIPAYLSYLTGSAALDSLTGRNKLSLFSKATGFVTGFTIIFILMGASASALGSLFSSNQGLFRKIGGIVIIILGLHTLGLFKIKFLYREKGLLPLLEHLKLGPVLIGMAFAVGWTPCIGPVLSSILIYAGSIETKWNGIFLLLVYSLGLAVPFLLTALAIDNFSNFYKGFKRFMPVASVLSGILLLIMGLMVLTNRLNILSRYLNFFKFF